MFHYENDSQPKEEKIEIPEELPTTYGVDTLILMIRDPYTAFAYWDFAPQRDLNHPVEGEPTGQLLLKIFKKSSKDASVREPLLHQELPIIKGTRSCYFELDENYDTYFAFIEFVPFFEKPVKVIDSNPIFPPQGSLAGGFDREWQSIEKIYLKFYDLVNKELKADALIEDDLIDEEIEALEELERQQEFEILDKFEQLEKDQKTDTFERIVEEKAAAEKNLTKLKSRKQKLLQRRQEKLRKIVSLYLENRATPGGIYSPALSEPIPGDDDEKD